uniref:T-box transcription factor mls-1-like isoform X3 n=1 Tax=Crassostrea virginica TaxID=6565 RepID=A0A8B8DIS7_CRAVI|nr:T-box transcription factor mls-1-like isoform X3 [Crassostrea virginica]
MDLRKLQVGGPFAEYLMKLATHKPLTRDRVCVSTISTTSPESSDKSSSDMETPSSYLDVCQAYAQSSSSGNSGRHSYEEDGSEKSVLGETDDCIQQINGAIVLSLVEAKLWYRFLELGTEMIINKTGRRMFPYLEFSLRGVDPVGLYDVIFDIIPASGKCFKFLNNRWMPIGKKEDEFKNHPFKHPDSPQVGAAWMMRKISFDKVRLSNKPGTGAGIFTLHTLQKYLVRISIVKHERDDELSVVEFPIRATTFIAVTAYNNRDVTKLKINSNPYSKGFRFPIKRMRNQSVEKRNTPSDRTFVNDEELKKRSVFCPIDHDASGFSEGRKFS